ncbi:LOW QUALITY PROTEIN: T4 family peptidase, partial [Streptomyces griseoflavus Tu4000]
MTADALTDVAGVRVGHATRAGAGWLTGTTVVLAPEGGAVAAVDVRGGGPGTKETDALDPRNVVQRIDAIVLTGGSAYGLDAASGVMAWLEERGRGVRVGPDPAHVVPVVPAACVFDLGRGGDFRARPDAATGRAAVEAAAREPGGPVPQGCVGAGTGAVVGQLKGGVGTASTVLDSGVTVAALVVANAAGSAVDPETGVLYGELFGGRVRYPEPEVHEAALRRLAEVAARHAAPPLNTTLAVVATDAALSRAQAQKLAGTAHAGGGRHGRRPVQGTGAETGRHRTRRHRAGGAAGASAERRRHGLHPGHGRPPARPGGPPRPQRGPGGGRGHGDPRDRPRAALRRPDGRTGRIVAVVRGVVRRAL